MRSCRSPTSRRRRPRPFQAHEVALCATLVQGVAQNVWAYPRSSGSRTTWTTRQTASRLASLNQIRRARSQDYRRSDDPGAPCNAYYQQVPSTEPNSQPQTHTNHPNLNPPNPNLQQTSPKPTPQNQHPKTNTNQPNTNQNQHQPKPTPTKTNTNQTQHQPNPKPTKPKTNQTQNLNNQPQPNTNQNQHQTTK